MRWALYCSVNHRVEDLRFDLAAVWVDRAFWSQWESGTAFILGIQLLFDLCLNCYSINVAAKLKAWPVEENNKIHLLYGGELKHIVEGNRHA